MALDTPSPSALPRLGRGVLMAMLVGATVPAAAMFRCVVDGKTTFQELPCATGARQTEIRTPYEVKEPPFVPSVGTLPAPVVPVPSASAPPTATAPGPSADQLKLDALEAERLRRDAAYALRDRLAEYQRVQASCERDHGVIFTRNADADRSITSAVYPQNPLDPSANAAAARCIAKVNEVQQQLGVARVQCTVRKCE